MKQCIYFTLVVLLSLFILSCDKEENPISYFKCGECSNSDHYFEFAQPLEIQLSLDSSMKYYKGSDSIDLDFDGIQETIIRHLNWNPDSVQSMNPFTSMFPYYRFESPSIGFVNISTPAGGGTYVDFLAILDSNEIISEKKYFKQASLQKLYQANPSSLISYGPWYDYREIAFVGYNYLGKYGWIKIDNRDSLAPKIIGYCYQN